MSYGVFFGLWGGALLGGQALALDRLSIQFERPTEGTMRLYSDDCNSLHKSIVGLNQWNARRQGVEFGVAREIPTGGQACRAELSILPNTTLSEQFTVEGEPAFFGPQNCWNLALNAAGVLRRNYRFSSEAEFSLSARLFCTHREGLPMPGDLIVVRKNVSHTEVHAFLFISSELSLTKNGVGAMAMLQPISSTLKEYLVSPECAFFAGQPGDHLQCANYAAAYSCDPAAPVLPPSLIEPWNALKTIDQSLTTELDYTRNAPSNTDEDQAVALFRTHLSEIQNHDQTFIHRVADLQGSQIANSGNNALWLDLMAAKAASIQYEIQGLLNSTQ